MTANGTDDAPICALRTQMLVPPRCKMRCWYTPQNPDVTAAARAELQQAEARNPLESQSVRLTILLGAEVATQWRAEREAMRGVERAQLKDLLNTYVDDREIFETAINKANAQIKNSSSNSLNCSLMKMRRAVWTWKKD